MSIKTRFLAIVAIVLVAVGAFPLNVSATHSWGGYHWARTSNPFTVQLGNNLSGTWYPHLEITSADWSASSVLDTMIVAGATTGRKCRPTVGRVEVCNASYGKTARPGANLDQRRPYCSGHRQDERYLFQSGPVQHA
jgi:hypothetical protein